MLTPVMMMTDESVDGGGLTFSGWKKATEEFEGLKKYGALAIPLWELNIRIDKVTTGTGEVSPAFRHSTALSDFQSVEGYELRPNLANRVVVPSPKFIPEKKVLVEPVDIAR